MHKNRLNLRYEKRTPYRVSIERYATVLENQLTKPLPNDQKVVIGCVNDG